MAERHTRRRTGDHRPDRGSHPRRTTLRQLLRHGAAVAVLGAGAALMPQAAATAHGPVAAHQAAVPKSPARATSAAAKKLTAPAAGKLKAPAAKKRTARAANTPKGARATARVMVAQRGWSTKQYKCLAKLWHKESRWRVTAKNSSSSAYGIPQALPGRKMRSAGRAWRTDAATQIRWGLRYIEGRYDTPCRAWGHSRSTGWY
ncbi:hypothetical protein EV385_5979 [Krasilnikovia cinnamomea]|uniref:Transglycosylase-like protein with SLT domain n=1 Tax=Krasilnikovia cinnamomea TaxID=349313 RepID=A0A4Q7ZS92_9ACTN|nr:lytic transglycosylase domain-containing protein [Krasilnikovia cinnamomea]RZU54042.1 hypothetical protein EV385_5979 [Krasilnikovia cinnamomea]